MLYVNNPILSPPVFRPVFLGVHGYNLVMATWKLGKYLPSLPSFKILKVVITTTLPCWFNALSVKKRRFCCKNEKWVFYLTKSGRNCLQMCPLRSTVRSNSCQSFSFALVTKKHFLAIPKIANYQSNTAIVKRYLSLIQINSHCTRMNCYIAINTCCRWRCSLH